MKSDNDRFGWWLARAGCAAGLAGVLTACSHVGPHEQRLVSKPNMEFSDSPVFRYQSRLTPQVEPGSTTSGGAQSSGCTSCK